MDTLINEIADFIESSLSICASNKWDKDKLSIEEVSVLSRLNGYCSMLSQSLLQMIYDGMIWECEIIMRPISEGTIKLLYICSDISSMSEKIRQYCEELPDYSYNKDSSRAASYIEKVGNVSEVQKHSYLELEKFQVDVDKPRKERKIVSQNWSYLEMLKQIESASIPFMDKISALAYGYGLSSHFVHADFEALGLIWDRLNREDEERHLVQNAHKSRFLGDTMTMALVRAWILVQIGNGEPDEYKKLAITFNTIMGKILEISKPWDDFYIQHYM